MSTQVYLVLFLACIFFIIACIFFSFTLYLFIFSLYLFYQKSSKINTSYQPPTTQATIAKRESSKEKKKRKTMQIRALIF